MSLKGWAIGLSVFLLFAGLTVFQILTNGPSGGSLLDHQGINPSPPHEPLATSATKTSKKSPIGVATSTSCPNNGIAAPLSGQCNKTQPPASFNIEPVSCPPQFATTELSCSHSNTWSLSKAGFPLDVVPEGFPSLFNMFKINATKSSAGNILDANLTLHVLNSGKCSSSITSVVVVLEQSTTIIGTGNSYGPGGKNYKVWASSGSENPTSAGLCNTPGMAQTCDSTCNVSVPYISDTIRDQHTQLPLNLSGLIVPANSNCSTGLTLNLNVIFRISDANLTQILMNPSGYRFNILLTFDACCDRGAACGININCQGPTEVIRTIQTKSPMFTFPSACSDDNCASVKIKDSLFPLITSGTSDSPNPYCLWKYDVLSSPVFDPSGLTTSTSIFNHVIPGRKECIVDFCACAGSGSYNVTITNTAFLAPVGDDSCLDSITGASLLNPGQSTAMHTFQCAFPHPIDCQVSEWSEWSVIVPCGPTLDPVCAIRSERTRTVTIAPCHGGLACAPLSETREIPCSTACEYHYGDGVNCELSGICNPITCNETALCSQASITPSHCSAGGIEECPPLSYETAAACTTPCAYSTWSVWSVYGPCTVDVHEDCIQVRTRLRRFESVCPPEAQVNCIDTEQNDILRLQCPCPVPSPTPTPIPTINCQYTSWSSWTTIVGSSYSTNFANPCDDPQTPCNSTFIRIRGLINGNPSSCTQTFQSISCLGNCSGANPTPTPTPTPTTPTVAPISMEDYCNIDPLCPSIGHTVKLCPQGLCCGTCRPVSNPLPSPTPTPRPTPIATPTPTPTPTPPTSTMQCLYGFPSSWSGICYLQDGEFVQRRSHISLDPLCPPLFEYVPCTCQNCTRIWAVTVSDFECVVNASNACIYKLESGTLDSYCKTNVTGLLGPLCETGLGTTQGVECDEDCLSPIPNPTPHP